MRRIRETRCHELNIWKNKILFLKNILDTLKVKNYASEKQRFLESLQGVTPLKVLMVRVFTLKKVLCMSSGKGETNTFVSLVKITRCFLYFEN